MAVAPRWKNRPEGSTWGDWGPEDQLGRLNLITREKVLQGIAEVREGITFCLSLPLDYPGGTALNPRRHPPVLRPTLRNTKTNYLYKLADDDPDLIDVINDDAAILHLQYSSQWDSLAHVGRLFDADGDGVPEVVFYNGFRGGVDILGPSDVKDAGATGEVPAKSTCHAHKLGVENMAEKCIQGRAVMIDLLATFGYGRRMIGYEDLKRVMRADKVAVEAGDMICIHTGSAQRVVDMKKNPDKASVDDVPALDGRDERLLNWITESQLSALIADNHAVEAQPASPMQGQRAQLPLHGHCLFKLGVNLGEYWHLTPLAQWLRANNRNRFLLTAPPLRLPGAVGSPPSPIATV
ncbi:MAG: cyclase family protein [Vulcanimicrobiaceae bacterium]